MASEQPLLTIAIPTYNRAIYLKELLSSLAVELVGHPSIELLISDNASSDETPTIIQEFQRDGLELRWLRNDANIGPDANFMQCFTEARGKYVWLLGDDDVVVPGAIRKIIALLKSSDYALVYVSSYSFRENVLAERTHDRFGRVAQAVPNGTPFIEQIGAMVGFISAMIANKEKYNLVSRIPLSSLVDSNLMHLGWLLPILEVEGESLIIWEKLLAARAGNSAGWSISKVFGSNLDDLVRRRLRIRAEIGNALLNSTLRHWFPFMIMQMRRGLAGPLLADDVCEMLRPRFGSNWRYWVFIVPVARLPYPLARTWYVSTQLINRITRFLGASLTYFRWRKHMIWVSD